MKKRMYDDQKVILSSCLDFIEEAISRGDSYSEITCGVQILFHSNYGTLRNMFSTYTPFPLHKYYIPSLSAETIFAYPRTETPLYLPPLLAP